MKKLKLLILTSFIGLAVSVGNGQDIPVSISKAILHCNGSERRVAVQFDKSLQSVIESARFAALNAPDDVARRLATKNLEALIENVLKLGKPNRVQGLNILLLNAAKESAEALPTSRPVYRLTSDTPLEIQPQTQFETAIKTGKMPDISKKDVLPDVLWFKMSETPDADSALGLLMEGLTEDPQMAPISIDTRCKEKTKTLPAQTQLSATEIPGRRLRDQLQPEEDKDKANLTIDFSFSNTAKTEDNPKPKKASFALSFVPKHFTKLGAHGIYEFRPVFLDTKYDKAGDTTNVLTQVGTRLDHTFVFGDDGRSYSKDNDKRQVIPGFTSSVTGKLDIYRLFEAIDAIGEFQGGIPVNIFQNRTWKVRFEQNFGISLGGNLKRPEDSARIALTTIGSSPSKLIARPFHYSELGIDFGQSGFFKIHFNANYRRSYPLTAEARFNDKGDTTIGYSSLPRDLLKAKLTFDFGKFASPFISFERGRQSPGYVLINNKIDVGFTIKIKGKDR